MTKSKNKSTLTMPYIKLYHRDLLAHAAREMHFDAFGGFIILLCFAWDSDPPATIPADEEAIRKILGADKDQWAAMRGQILAKFEPFEADAGRLVNARLRKEWLEATEKHDVNSKRGKAAAAKRWHGTTGSEPEEPEAGGFVVEEDADLD
jgi:uncharacterized protein YdaU (DUF1376 family)